MNKITRKRKTKKNGEIINSGIKLNFRSLNLPLIYSNTQKITPKKFFVLPFALILKLRFTTVFGGGSLLFLMLSKIFHYLCKGKKGSGISLWENKDAKKLWCSYTETNNLWNKKNSNNSWKRYEKETGKSFVF